MEKGGVKKTGKEGGKVGQNHEVVAYLTTLKPCVVGVQKRGEGGGGNVKKKGEKVRWTPEDRPFPP